MALIKKQWTVKEAEEWRKQDLLAVIISPLLYVGYTLGVFFSLMLRPIGYIILLLSVGLTVFMVAMIDPKLSTISEDYEKKQKAYLLELEKRVKWEE